MTYGDYFYRLIRQGCRDSAHAVAPLAHDLLGLAAGCRVVDIGCGEGWWAHEFAMLGANILGVDSARPDGSPLTAGQFQAADLETTLPYLVGDLVVCLEVGEHLTAGRADGFIAELCQIAPLILWSAAIPGQGGMHHINEQWPGYWVDKFEANQFTVSGALRWMLWDDQRVEPWYRQNLLVATRNPRALPTLFDTPTATPRPVVHPDLWTARTSS